jgi:hypothetical protein
VGPAFAAIQASRHGTPSDVGTAMADLRRVLAKGGAGGAGYRPDAEVFHVVMGHLHTDMDWTVRRVQDYVGAVRTTKGRLVHTSEAPLLRAAEHMLANPAAYLQVLTHVRDVGKCKVCTQALDAHTSVAATGLRAMQRGLRGCVRVAGGGCRCSTSHGRSRRGGAGGRHVHRHAAGGAGMPAAHVPRRVLA